MRLGRTGKILLVLAVLLLLAASGAFLYFNDFHHSEDVVNEYLQSGDNVSIIHIDEGYYFKGRSSDTAVIFYPGAKVEYSAYAPMMYGLAENGVDCFLIEMPLNMAFFGADKASLIIENYNYSNYYLSGHSLGGVVASSFANENADKVRGVILFASYPSSKMDDRLRLLSIYGSEDGVLNMESYDENMNNWPEESEEYVIKGANHAGFAYYGYQEGDNNASISPKEQQDTAIERILEFI